MFIQVFEEDEFTALIEVQVGSPILVDQVLLDPIETISVEAPHGDVIQVDVDVTTTAMAVDAQMGIIGEQGPRGFQGEVGPVGPQGPPGGAVITGWWQYNNVTTPPPAPGQLRTVGDGNGPVGSAVVGYLAHTDDDGLVWPDGLIKPKDRVYTRDETGDSWRISVTSVSTPVAGPSGYDTINGVLLSTTASLVKNQRVEINIIRDEEPVVVIQSYRYVQVTADTTWNVTHPLDFRPNITAVDSAGTEILPGDVKYIGTDTVQLIFSSAVGGEAYLS